MIEKLTQDTVLSAFTDGADQLAALVSGLSEAELDLSLGPGEWSIRQIVHHVSDDGDVWSFAMKKALAVPNAALRFSGFPGNEAWADRLAFDRRGIGPSLALIRAHREAMSELAGALPDEWACSGSIENDLGEEMGRFSVPQILTMLSDHLAEHIATIKAIRERHHI